MTAKEIYDRRKRLAAERKLRQEEREALRDIERDEGEIIIASLAASLERIADAMERMAQRMEPSDGG